MAAIAALHAGEQRGLHIGVHQLQIGVQVAAVESGDQVQERVDVLLRHRPSIAQFGGARASRRILGWRCRRRTSNASASSTARYNAGERAPAAGSGTRTPSTTPPARIGPRRASGDRCDRQAVRQLARATPTEDSTFSRPKSGGDQVFLWLPLTGHGAASGIPLEMELAHVLTLHDGKAASVVEYSNRTEASRPWRLSE